MFESGANSITSWADRAGYPTVLVTVDGRYFKGNWRKPANIFRRGDQSNMLIHDRHTQLLENASPEEKRKLSLDADTLALR